MRFVAASLAGLVLPAAVALAQQESVVVLDAPRRNIVAFSSSADGGTIAAERFNPATNSSDVFVLDLRASATRLVERRVHPWGKARFASLDRAGATLAFLERDPGLSRWMVWTHDLPAASDVTVGYFPLAEEPQSVRISPDGKRVAVVTRQGGTYRLRFFGPGTTLTPVTSTLIEAAPAGQIWWQDSSAVVVTMELSQAFGWRAIVEVNATTGAVSSLGGGTRDRLATVAEGTPEQAFFVRTVTLGGSSLRVMRANRGSLSATEVANLGPVTVTSAAAALDGSRVILSSNSMGGYDVFALVVATGALSDLTQRNAGTPFVAPWPDRNADIAWFVSVVPGAPARSVLEAVNVRPPDVALETPSATPLPPFDLDPVVSRCAYPPDFPVHFELECETLVRNGEDMERKFLTFADATVEDGTLRTAGPHVVRAPAGDAVRVGDTLALPCQGGLRAHVRLSVIDPTTPQDDVVFGEQDLTTRDWCPSLP